MDDQTKDVVREALARLARGEHVKAMARELGVDKQTLKRWRQRGAWRPRAPRVYPNAIDAYRPFLERCGPEGGWDGGASAVVAAAAGAAAAQARFERVG